MSKWVKRREQVSLQVLLGGNETAMKAGDSLPGRGRWGEGQEVSFSRSAKI